jgi:hypothetical protein
VGEPIFQMGRGDGNPPARANSSALALLVPGFKRWPLTIFVSSIITQQENSALTRLNRVAAVSRD